MVVGVWVLKQEPAFRFPVYESIWTQTSISQTGLAGLFDLQIYKSVLVNTRGSQAFLCFIMALLSILFGLMLTLLDQLGCQFLAHLERLLLWILLDSNALGSHIVLGKLSQ